MLTPKGFETQNLCVSVLLLTAVSCEDSGELAGVLSGQWLSPCFPEGRVPDLPRGGWVRWPGALLPTQDPALTSHRAGELWPPRVFLGIFLAIGGGALAGARVSVNPGIVCFHGGCVLVGPDPLCALSTHSTRPGTGWLPLASVSPQPGEMPFPLSFQGEASGTLALSWVHDRVGCGMLADLFLLISGVPVPSVFAAGVRARCVPNADISGSEVVPTSLTSLGLVASDTWPRELSC